MSPIDLAAVRAQRPARGPAAARDRARDLQVVAACDLARTVRAEAVRQPATLETSSTWADPPEAVPARAVGRAAAALWPRVARLQAARSPAAQPLISCNNVPAAVNPAPVISRPILVPARVEAANSCNPARDRDKAAPEPSGQQRAPGKAAPERNCQQLGRAKAVPASGFVQATMRGRTVLARAALANAGIEATRAIGPTIAPTASTTAIA
jgi:hypothetical protein